jgi:hypothetical protein
MQALKLLVKKIKDTLSISQSAQSAVLHDLLACKDSGEQPFLIHLLSRISDVKVDEGSLHIEGDGIDRNLLGNHRFQAVCWLLTQHVYEILCGLGRPSSVLTITPEQHQKFLQTKRDIENVAQITLLQDIQEFQDGYMFPHPIDMLRLIA